MARCRHSPRWRGLPHRLGPDRARRDAAQELSYRRLLERLDHWFEAGVRSALPVAVPCRSGCAACCHGPFDISAADARLLGEAVAALPNPLADAIRIRANRQLEAGTTITTEWQSPWHVSSLSEDTFDVMCDALEQEPCPALDPESGACLIHADRPATCRLMGMSVRTPEGDLLDNLCPIQAQFPDYAALAPTPLDLMQFEVDAAQMDLEAMADGWHATTVAGAIAAGS
ncbi:MAG: YkgJ family cysteine cluster protein [Gemmatimonadota bacterium]